MKARRFPPIRDSKPPEFRLLLDVYSALMGSLSAKLLKNNEEKYEGINDLKSAYQGVKYALETIKIVLEKAETILMEEAIQAVTERISKIGRIHHPKTASFTA